MSLKLQSRLMILVLASFIPFVVASFIWTVKLRNSAYISIQMREQLITRILTERQSSLIGSVRSVLSILSLNPLILDGNTSNDRAILEKTADSVEGLLNVALVDTNGMWLSGALPGSNTVTYTDRLWFTDVMKNRKFTLGDYVVGKTTKVPILPTVFPIFGADGEIKNLLAASIDMNWIYSLADELQLPENTTITITNPRGNLLVRYPDPEKYVGTDIGETDLGKEMKKNEHEYVSFKGLEGIPRLYMISPLVDGDMLFGSIALGFSTEFINKESNEALRVNIIFFAAVFFFTLAFLIWGLRVLVISPARKLLTAFEKLASGESKYRLEIPPRQDEISLLMGAFNGMATELQGHRDRLETLIEHRTRELEKSTLELKRSNQELEQFAYVASHDLQEPLRMVASFSQLIAERYKGKLDAKADEYIFYIVDGAKRMQALINDLLLFSRVGTKGKEMEETDTSTVLSRVLEILDPSIKQNDIRIIIGHMPRVMADPIQLAQVFQNLITNAIKFRSDTDPEIEISAERTGNAWTFNVKDNGIGIEKQYFERIFIVFQRLHERDKYPGNGIGLSIVKKIIDRHGGRLSVESEPGKGTKFFFTLPDIHENGGT